MAVRSEVTTIGLYLKASCRLQEAQGHSPETIESVPFDGAPEMSDLLDPETSAWSVQLEARVCGSLDEPRLRKALAEALSRQPATHDPLRVVTPSPESA